MNREQYILEMKKLTAQLINGVDCLNDLKILVSKYKQFLTDRSNKLQNATYKDEVLDVFTEVNISNIYESVYFLDRDCKTPLKEIKNIIDTFIIEYGEEATLELQVENGSIDYYIAKKKSLEDYEKQVIEAKKSLFIRHKVKREREIFEIQKELKQLE